MNKLLSLLLILTAGMLLVAPARAQDDPDLPEPDRKSPVEIPYQKFTLDNGLTVLIHEDHKAPIAAVNVWYHVGSKNEVRGKTGFAHLFEHLMFNGSENNDDDYFQVMERIGATNLNGTTNNDRTNYFQNVPINALDRALWMESDRMGHLLGAIDQEKLDEQRGVVQNEKRQGENQPYGRVFNVITENTYPDGHPYSHTVIGSMDDLDAASLEDVQTWFKTYYGPSNAVIAVAGDIDTEDALNRVKKFFGDIPPGPPIEKHDTWVAKRTGTHRMHLQDRVPQSRIYKVWNTPEWGNADADYLNLASDILASGKTSRLYKRMVYDDQIATDVGAFIQQREIAGLFMIQASARPGQKLSTIEMGLDEELAAFLRDGPTDKEMERVRTGYLANFVRGAEQIGGFGGKSDILAQNEIYGGDAGLYETRLNRIQSATKEDVVGAARRWLSDGVLILDVTPFPELTNADSGADRSRLAPLGEAPVTRFPAFERQRLANGLTVILSERHATPLVEFSLQVDAGYASDQFGTPGTASLAMNMLDEGTTTRDALAINESLALLGASLRSGSNLDVSSVSMSALRENLGAALDIYTDVILNPSFPEQDFDRLKQQQSVAIQREQQNPIQMALRVFPGLLYGKDHAYGLPFTGSGTQDALASISREDLKTFHETWFKPGNATLVVVGDITMSELKPMLDDRFGSWKSGAVPTKNITKVSQKDHSTVYLMDRPGAQQSIIFAGHVAPPKSDPHDIEIGTMNAILGGTFTSRINMNLREDKSWSYGTLSLVLDARGQRPFIVYAPVQTDKTSESMGEIIKEIDAYLGESPVTMEELSKAKKSQTLTLPGQWETNAAVQGSLNQMVQFGLADDYFDTFPGRVTNQQIDEINAAAHQVLHPEAIVWVIVGDLSRIEEGIRGLGIADIRHLDADGNEIPTGSD